MESLNRSQKSAATPLWYAVALLVTAGGVVFTMNSHALAGETEAKPKVFKLENARQARRIVLHDFTYGTATVKLTLDSAGSGKVTHSQLEPDAIRRGDEAFDDTLIEIMRTWKYTEGVKGPLWVTVSIPSDSEAREGKLPNISVDLSRVELPADNSVTIKLEKEHELRLVAQEGFFDNVNIAAAPPKVEELYKEKGSGAKVRDVLRHLGGFFQGLFFFVFVALFAATYLTVRRFRRLWEPPKDEVKIGKIKIVNRKYPLFESPAVQQVRDLWIQSIVNTQLGPALFTNNGLTPEKLKELKTAVSSKSTGSGVQDILEADPTLGRMLGPDFFYKGNNHESPPDLEGLKATIKGKLQGDVLLDKARVKSVLDKLDDCQNKNELRELLDKAGLNAEQLMMVAPQERELKTDDELRVQVTHIIDTLLEMQEIVDVNGSYSKNGAGSGESNKEGGSNGSHHDEDKKEEEYEKFLWRYFGEPRINEAIALCNRNKRYPVFEIFKSGLQNHLVNRNSWWASQEIDRSIDRTAAVKFEEKRGILDWLWAIGSLSPMFGLFGTVWGISQAFGKIKGVTDTRLLMQKLAGDINIALATTIVGLVLGVIAFAFYYYAKYYFDRDATEIEKNFTEITNHA